jgi:TP901 family phage tail tape measure protein
MMANSAKIKIVADTKVKKAINSTIGQLKRLGKASRNATRAMARGVGGVIKKFTSLRGLLVGGALTAGLAKSVADANAFAQSMAQVNTILDDNGGQVKSMTLAVRDLSAELGIAANELSDGLYQALSAGIPADNAIDFLAIASKVAVAGATDVTSAVDLMTTVLNAFKLESSETARVADVLFQTVKLGKTTIGELAQSLALVAPLAASSGVSIEEVAAAVATLTKQGTPTAQAMTQIRAALVATNDVLGDGWSKTMSLQDAFKAVAKQAGGSQVKLRKLTKSVEAMGAVLATTGDSAKGAAADLKSVEGAAGAYDRANKKIQVTKHWARLFHSVKASILAVAGAIDMGLSPLVDAVAAKFRKLAANAGPMEGLAQKIKEFSINAVSKLDAVFKRIKDGAIGVAAVIKALSSPEKQTKTLGLLGSVVVAMFQDAVTIAIKMLLAAAPIIGGAIGQAIRDAFENTVAHAKEEGILRGQAASAVEASRGTAAMSANLGAKPMPGSFVEMRDTDKSRTSGVASTDGNNFKDELAKARQRRADAAVSGAFGATDSESPAASASKTATAIDALAKSLAHERGAIQDAASALTGGLQKIAMGDDDRGRFLKAAQERKQAASTKVETEKKAKAAAQMSAFSLDRVQKSMLGMVFGKKKKFQPEMLGRGVTRRAESPRDGEAEGANVGGLVRRQLKGIQRGKLLLNAGIRLEKKEAETEKGVTERRGIGMAELFDMKQFGFAGKDDKLGTKNNPMVVAVSEELV